VGDGTSQTRDPPRWEMKRLSENANWKDPGETPQLVGLAREAKPRKGGD
jgi:hypothetical protein